MHPHLTKIYQVGALQILFQNHLNLVLIHHCLKVINLFGVLVQALTPITDANIQTAVDLWVSDPSAATTTYGAISDWDVSQVTDMSELFKIKLLSMMIFQIGM